MTNRTMNLSTWTKPLNYRGDRRDSVPEKVGPNMDGEYFWPVYAEYDPDQDRTTIDYAMILP